MKDTLAEKVLAKIMNWSAKEISEERPLLQTLAEFKYDEYQQFSPGMNFIENLACWLSQFEEIHRPRMYKFVKNSLVFISSSEMVNLISIVFPDFIRPILMKATALKLGCNEYHLNKIVNDLEYKRQLRKCLFLGLSDGSNIATFRRFNTVLSNEQVLQSYDFSNEKADELVDELKKDLERINDNGEELNENDCKFKYVFLMDDFSASGKSYFRKETDIFKGKVYKIIDRLLQHPTDVIDKDNATFYLVLYVATQKAQIQIEEHMSEFISSINKPNISFSIQVIYKISDNISHLDCDAELESLLKKYFDDLIVDQHFKKGKHDRPYLGFDECGLSLVLSHNTPNNSLPILWFDESNSLTGLFPRITRHK